MQKIVAIAGGGAAGFFAAINIAELDPDIEIHIYEKASAFLQKVKISGGGRCNITNNCSQPEALIQYYPRGSRELLGPFHRFGPAETVEWFTQRGIPVIAEADGRMFPASNSSQSVIDLFMRSASEHNIHLHLNQSLQRIEKTDTGKWQLHFQNNTSKVVDSLLLCTGSSNNIWKLTGMLGHIIETPVPSLFTFNIKDPRIDGLMGLSVADCRCSLPHTKLSSEGPLLITHWGLSGPAILKLSALAARELHTAQYRFKVQISFAPGLSLKSCLEILNNFKDTNGKKNIQSSALFNIPARLFKKICTHAGIPDNMHWAEIPGNALEKLASGITAAKMEVNGKSNFKDEFVTCGGIRLKEVDFRTMQSKLHNGLYFAGEILDIDAVTGGFNFQAAWTTAFIAANAIAYDG